ncbi:hypothetical protein SNE40_012871 [Patella caerulea]|uniref:Uncharacterized protein n=1 Tax=Patella caerulea TaxID=87958 RepID=A0AAN8PG25_PATCE
MEMTDSLYKINHENSTLQANITEDGNWGTVEDLPNFNFYEAVLRQTWFGKDIHTCGQHTYNLSDANVKPVKATLQATAGIFNDYFPLSKFIVESIHQPLGAVEAYMNFTIASPQKC